MLLCMWMLPLPCYDGNAAYADVYVDVTYVVYGDVDVYACIAVAGIADAAVCDESTVGVHVVDVVVDAGVAEDVVVGDDAGVAAVVPVAAYVAVAVAVVVGSGYDAPVADEVAVGVDVVVHVAVHAAVADGVVGDDDAGYDDGEYVDVGVTAP